MRLVRVFNFAERAIQYSCEWNPDETNDWGIRRALNSAF